MHNLPFGDHRPIVGNIYRTTSTHVVRIKSTGLWKLNAAILEEDEYVELVHVFIEEMSQHPSRIDYVDCWWENTFKSGQHQNQNHEQCKFQSCMLHGVET